MLLVCGNCGTERDYSVLSGSVSCPECGAGEDALRPTSEVDTAGHDVDSPVTVLFAEDDDELRETYRLWLSPRDDWYVREAADGEEALAELDDSVDVLVLDRRMPELSGDEVVDALDDRGFDGDILVVSAHDEDAHLSGVDVAGYLTKPLRRETFLTALGRLVED